MAILGIARTKNKYIGMDLRIDFIRKRNGGKLKVSKVEEESFLTIVVRSYSQDMLRREFSTIGDPKHLVGRELV